ncbi:MAG: bacterial Ig-like domain-containing protein [Bacteroidales bacterium]|nr:bacterial Ig-like domain-containing protein [Bacteroidales bacterium]
MRKSNLLRLLWAVLVVMLLPVGNSFGQEAYAVFEDGTLTFKYDNQRPTNAYSIRSSYNNGWSSIKTRITKVVFDDSFKDYPVTSCAYWFYECYNLTEIVGMKDNLNTQNVTSMSCMFCYCSKLTSLDLSGFDTQNVTSMGAMFRECYNLTSLDLSGFDTQNVTSMSSMFRYCRKLQTIFIGDNWSTDAVEVSQDLFTDCNNLYGGQGSTVEECELTDKTYAKIDGGLSNPGYFTKANTSAYTATSIEITSFPQKRQYYQGEMLNLSEGILTITFADKPTKTIPLHDAEIIFDNMKPGNQAVIVKYLGKETSYDVYVIDISDGPYYNNRKESFEITTANELLWFANHANTVNNEANAILKNDIVVNENLLEKIENKQTSDLISWIPIGTKENPYKGSFKTDTFSISGLYYNDPQKDYVGFFGYYDNDDYYGTTYLLIKDSYFAGHNYVGGIFGYGSNAGTRNSYFRGMVSGNKNVGGLIGYKSDESHNSNTSIETCYVSAKVIGNENVGSICGVVDGDSYPSYCYYNTLLSTIGAINGKDNTERNLKGINNFHSGEAAYAMHIYQDLSDPSSWPEFKGKRVHRNLSGEGYHNPEYEEHHCKHCINYTYTLPPLVGDVYQISNADELYGFMHIVNSGNIHANAILTQDIVVNENVLEKVKSGKTSDLREWYSIGDGGYLGYHDIKGGFAGVLDGNFHTISGLYFNNKVIYDEVQVGFVGILHGTIKNIIVTDTYFESITSVSGIACHMNQMSADNSIFNANPVIENCIFDGEINSNGSAAGICYSHSGIDDGLIKNCINYGKISGSSFSSGILGAGWNTATIINCYNVGEIICNDKEGAMNGGGIYGWSNGGSISSCFNTGLISFDYSVCGYHWGNLTISNTYNNQDVCNLPLTSSDNTTITGGGQTTSDYLCNGELPEGFSSSDWIPGKTETDGDVTFYTFPHLKVFDGIYPAYTLKKEPQAVSITLTTPTKTEYFEKENLDLTGCELLVSYDNSKTEKVELSKASISGFDNTKIGEQTIKVSYLGLETEFKVTVSSKPIVNPYTEPAIKDGVYQISTAEELFWFMFDVNHGDVKANAALVNDIIINKDCLKRVTAMLNTTSKAAAAFATWQPIGTTENPYQGTFDGQGHTISGLYIDDNTTNNVGLFGNVAPEAVIKNLGVTDSYIAGNENVGAICGKSEGTMVNCYTISEVKGSKNVNPLVGAKTSASVVENCYYFAETPIANDPCAKTAEEFLSGNIAQLLSQGAVVNGVTYSGETFAGVTELPGTDIIPQPENNDNPSTPISSISENNIKVWSYNHTIYIENAPADTKYTIIDINGRVIATSTTKSTKEEINTNKSGIMILNIDNQSFKIAL